MPSLLSSAETETPPVRPSERSNLGPTIVGFVLLTITAIVYLPVRHYGFVAFDDTTYVSENPVVQGGLTWSAIRWAFTTAHASNWHPVTWLSHMADAQLFGTGAAAPHRVNVLFHLANVLLVFLVLRALTGTQWRSLFVAALFALHPLHVESVAWISERKDVLSAFFFLLTLLAYVRYVRERTARRSGIPNIFHPERSEGSSTAHASGHPAGSFAPLRMTKGDDRQQRGGSGPGQRVRDPNWVLHCAQNDRLRKGLGWYLAALLFFALGLMSKPMLVTVPFVLLLLDYWPLGRFATSRQDFESSAVNTVSVQAVFPVFWEKLPFFVLSGVSCVVTFVVQKQGGAVSSLTHYDLGDRMANAVVSYARYLGKTIWPLDLAVFCPHPGHWSAVAVAGAVTLAIALFATAVVIVPWRRFALVGWLWFFGMLVPTIGLVQVGSQSMADRYMYLPLLGVLIVAAWVAADVCARMRVPKPAMAVAATVLVGLSAKLTAAQVSYWRDSEALFSHAIACTAGNGLAHDKLGNLLLARGQVDQAIEHYARAVQFQPTFPEFHNNLANALWKQHRADEALAAYQAALQIDPRLALSHENMGNVLLELGRTEDATRCFVRALEIDPALPNSENNLGTILLEQRRFDEARVHIEKALRLNPEHPNARNNLGCVLLQKGRVEEAIVEFQRALQSRSIFPEALTNFGRALLQQGRADEGIAALRRALAAQPEFAEAHYRLGAALLQRGQADEAISHLRRAVALRDDSVEAHNDLGVAFMQQENADDALPHFRRAVEIDPGFAEGHSNLGKVLQMKGDVRGAAEHFEAALRHEPDNVDTLVSLAWIRATSPEPGVRDGAQSLALAAKADQAMEHKNPLLLRVLAAAYAEKGEFAKAVGAAERALEIAQHDPALATVLRSELQLYLSQAPLREPARPLAKE